MPDIIGTVSQWASNTKQFISWGFNAPIKFFFPTLNKFKGLNDTQRDTFDTLTDGNLKTYIKDGDEDNAKLVLDAIKTNSKIETLFAKLDDVSHLDMCLKFSTEQVDTFLDINDDEVRKFAEGLAEAKAKNLLDALKTNADLGKLDKNQIETLTNIADDEVRKFAEGLAETKAKNLLDALKANADLGKLDKNQIETLTNIADDEVRKFAEGLAETKAKNLLDALKTTPELLHVWKVLETTKGDGATHIAKFLKLDSTEAKNYLEIITGKDDGTATASSLNRDNIKTKLVSLSDDKVKQFLADFKAADTEKLLALDTKDSLIDIWKDVQYLNVTHLANTRVEIQFLENIDWLKNTGGGNHVLHHVLSGDIQRNSGNIVGISGVHSAKAVVKANADPLIDTDGDIRLSGVATPILGSPSGFYTKTVEVFDISTNAWITKAGNGGVSGCFPDTWTNDQIVEEIAYAKFNAIYKQNMKVVANGANGGVKPSFNVATTGTVINATLIPNSTTVAANKLTFSINPANVAVSGPTHAGNSAQDNVVSFTTHSGMNAVPANGTLRFSGNVYAGRTSHGDLCELYIKNPNDGTQTMASAFPKS